MDKNKLLSILLKRIPLYKIKRRRKWQKEKKD